MIPPFAVVILCTYSQVENLHEVYTLLDGEEQAAACKLRDSLDLLHQSIQLSDIIFVNVS